MNHWALPLSADISDEKKQAPIRALKKMFKEAVKEMQDDLTTKKGADITPQLSTEQITFSTFSTLI